MPYKDLEKRREYKKSYSKRPEQVIKARERCKKYWETHREELIKKKRQSYQDNIEARREEARNFYKENKERLSEHKSQLAKDSKKEAIIYKGSKCSVCGIEFDGTNACIFDFHHLNPDEKEFSPKRVLQNGLSKRALAELDKCILVCSNCHRLIHYKDEFMDL